MSSRSLKTPYGSYSVVLAIALITPFLSGCAAPGLLYVAQLIPTAIVGYQFLPGNTEAELTNPGKGATSNEVGKVRSIMTDNFYVEEYMTDIFKKITLVKTAPRSTSSAATMAKKGDHDAFLMVDVGGATARPGLIMKIIYGTATVKLVSSTNGAILYEQTATLTGKANSVQNLTDRQIAEALARVIVEDLKQSISTANSAPTNATTTAETQQNPSLWGKVKGIFD